MGRAELPAAAAERAAIALDNPAGSEKLNAVRLEMRICAAVLGTIFIGLNSKWIGAAYLVLARAWVDFLRPHIAP